MAGEMALVGEPRGDGAAAERHRDPPTRRRPPPAAWVVAVRDADRADESLVQVVDALDGRRSTRARGAAWTEPP
jgi:hypothetical protein